MLNKLGGKSIPLVAMYLTNVRLYFCSCGCCVLQASRETVSRLADYAEETTKDTTDQLYLLKAELEAERENSMSSEMKLRDFQVAF